MVSTAVGRSDWGTSHVTIFSSFLLAGAEVRGMAANALRAKREKRAGLCIQYT